jgi:hypothetical protein
MAKDFLGSYKEVLGRLKGDKAKLKEYRASRKEGQAERRAERATNRQVRQERADYAASIPAEYLNKYGSDAGSVWEADKSRQTQMAAAEQRIYNQAGATPADVQKYGSSAADIARARGLNQSALQTAQKRFEIGLPANRTAAVQESINLARSASQPATNATSIRDFYTKSFADKGNNPNVFGMKDLEHLENTGTSADDIRRIALTINRAGPLAAQRLAEKYGIKDPRFNY